MARLFRERSSGPVFLALSVLLSLMPISSCGTSGGGGIEPPPPPPASKDGWTWMAGSDAQGQAGVYGTKGQGSSASTPGGRESAVSWTDSNGSFWLFGGDSLAAPEHGWGPQNDLWKYDQATRQWTWISGNDSVGLPGVYGTRGVASPDNVPGSRSEAVSWADAHGGLWLFGGWGVDSGGHWGELNDLWRFDTAAKAWTWISGSMSFCQPSVYGTKGLAAPENTPGARTCAATWIDSCGKLWLFGGHGWDSLGENTGPLNDLWRFDPETLRWTWVSGSDICSPQPNYGTKGLPRPSNVPGGTVRAAAWIDAGDNLWLFGGGGTGGVTNALWKFDTTSLEWTWAAGSSVSGQAPNYGTKGVASSSNVPGAMLDALTWPGAAGEFWLFGGYSYAAPASGELNDLWKFDPASLEWTWMAGSASPGREGYYGTKGTASSGNFPGGRARGVSWKNAAQGELWLFGGSGCDQDGNSGWLNDLWRYHSIGPTTPPSTAPRVTLAPEVVTLDRTESVQFHAMVHHSANEAVVWSLAGAGCSGASCGTLSGSGLYTAPEIVPDPPTVTLTATSVADPSRSASAVITILDAAVVVTVAPDSAGVYVGEAVLLRTSVEHATDRDVIWSLAGAGCGGASCGTLSDSGLYTAPAGVPDPAMVTITATSASDPARSASATITILEAAENEWAWMSGSNLANEASVYGQKGLADPANVPAGRESAASWVDLSGRLWLFGGASQASPHWGYGNDLWMYDPATREWTWESGSVWVNRAGLYGVKGVPDAGNCPGSRVKAVTWVDPQGDLWLFGGFGYDVDRMTARELNDLWRYAPATGEWTWVSGGPGTYWTGVYGIKGIPDPANRPGARQVAVSWTDAAGDLWLFGGSGYDSTGQPGLLNDLWRFRRETGEWTWESGGDIRTQPGVYGAKGAPDPANVPGARTSAVSWLDSQGRLWLFGGAGWITATVSGLLNDLWRYDPATRMWTWMAGTDLRDQMGIYGTRGVPDASNAPGGRGLAVSWRDREDKLWLFGGSGLGSVSAGDTALNDLWSFDPATLEWTWVSGGNAGFQHGVYGIKGIADAANVPGSRHEAVSWVDLQGDLWLFGGNGLTDFSVGGVLNDLWKYYRRPSTGGPRAGGRG